jgi:hypothetical protein
MPEFGTEETESVVEIEKEGSHMPRKEEEHLSRFEA